MISPFKREFEYFLVLSRVLNISRAAEEVGIQQAGLSKTLKQLELQLGNALFYRTHRGLKLTPFGNELRLNLLESKKSWLRSADEEPEAEVQELLGRFKFGMHSSLAIRFAENFFAELCEQHPGIYIELFLDRSAEVVKNVVSTELDLGIVANPLRHPDLVIHELGLGSIKCWTRFPKNHSKVVYYNPDMIDIARHLRRFSNYKLIPVGDYEVIASLLVASQGVGVLPSSVAERYKGLRSVKVIMEEVSINLVHRYDFPRSPAFNLVKETVIKNVVVN